MTTFINDAGQEIQVSEDILITRQVASFKSFKIKGDFSVSFRVPNTSLNRTTLGYYGPNQIGSPVFSDNYFNLVRNGNIIMRGLIVIEEDGEDLSLYFISGNANWFKEFEFNCREIRSRHHSVYWNSQSVKDSVGKTEGIVFPLIDYICKGQKAEIYFEGYSFSGLSGDVFQLNEYFPCLYVHTLFDEISNHSGIKIDGTLLSDKFFKTLIFTPDEPDIYDPSTGTLLTNENPPVNFVKIEAIAPNMKAIEVLKWACVTFGVIPVYDEVSKTLTLDILDKRVLQGDDWSRYVQSSIVKYDQIQNNYIRVEAQPEDFFADYNAINETQFGEVNLQTDKPDGQSEDRYQSPFPVCYDGLSPTIDLAVPYIPMYELEDDQEYPYTSVASQQYVGTDPYRIFTGVGFPFDTNTLVPTIIRIEDDNGSDYYNGYFHLWSYLAIFNDFNTAYVYGQNKIVSPVTSTGKIYTQSISKGSPGTRVLSFIPSIAANKISNRSVLKLGGPVGTSGNMSDVPTAYFYKPWYSQYPDLNKYKQGLSYGYVTDYNDYSISEVYFNYLKGMLCGPTIKTKMLLPEKVFSEFNFEFIYINDGRLNGYYFVDSIVNYKDSVTPVEVNLLQVNRDYPIVESTVFNYALTAETGSYIISGQNLTLTYTPLTFDLEFSLQFQLGPVSFSTEFAGDQETKTLTRTTNSTAYSTLLYSSSVTATVTKTTNAGIDGVSVEWFKDNVSQDIQSIAQGNPVNVNYTFTSLTGTETLRVEVIEG